jgi:phosphate transport system permease protein
MNISIRDRLSVRDFQRKVINYLMISVLIFAAILAIFPLASVLIYVIKQGWSSLNWEFFTTLPKPIGETGGGLAHAILGTMILILTASAIGIPVGIAAGLYLSEYGTGKVASTLRFGIDLLASTPSIIIGIFAYAVLVVPLKHFSALAGGLSLAMIMIPTVARTTEELLKLVPIHVREAGLALGIPRWKVILRIVLRGSMGGIMTGVMLAVARAAGETAPLLFTAFNTPYWPKGLMQPIASLPVQIYNYAISPYEDWHRQAWAAALVLVLFVLVMNIITRLILQRKPVTRE